MVEKGSALPDEWQAGFRVAFLSLILLIVQEVLNKTITANIGESGMIIQIIKGYDSYARFRFQVNLETLNPPINRGKPVNRYNKCYGASSSLVYIFLQLIQIEAWICKRIKVFDPYFRYRKEGEQIINLKTYMSIYRYLALFGKISKSQEPKL